MHNWPNRPKVKQARDRRNSGTKLCGLLGRFGTDRSLGGSAKLKQNDEASHEMVLRIVISIPAVMALPPGTRPRRDEIFVATCADLL